MLFKTKGITQYTLSTKGAAERIIDDIINNLQQPINQQLYKQYADNLRKAIGSVYSLEGDDGLADQLRANVSRFAAYKAFHATQEVKQQLESSLEDAKKVIHTFNRYQAAEYNTAVGRCRTAKQFAEFAEKDNLRLFPNIRWLPSRSVKLREEHIPFYNRIWAKTDPFWVNNQPGNLWNCKCDWEQTDDPITDGNPTTNIRHNGLEGNPAITGEIFTDNASYFNVPKGIKTECNKIMRKEYKAWAKENLQGKSIDVSGIEITITGVGIKEYLNQPHKHYYIKNELLRNLDRVLKNAKYKGMTIHKEKISHIFEIKMKGDNSWIIVHEEKNGAMNLYSISDNSNVLKKITA